LGGGVGCGLLGGRLSETLAWAQAAKWSPEPPVNFAPGTIIRTVLKDIPAQDYKGIILFHEHVNGREVDPVTIEEMQSAERVGITGISSAMGGGNMELLKEYSQRANMNIIACGGYYLQSSYPPEVKNGSEDEVADILLKYVTSNPIGAFGVIGQTNNTTDLPPLELKVFRAIGKTSVRTGIPIFTHAPYGTGTEVGTAAGMKELDAFESVGVDPKKVCIGHVSSLDDPKATTMKELGKRGCYVGYDRMGAIHNPDARSAANGRPIVLDVPDDQLVRNIIDFIDAGYVEQLLLAEDATAQGHKAEVELTNLVNDMQITAAEGARMKNDIMMKLAYGRVMYQFIPKLRAAGVQESHLKTILYDNPRRFFGFVPKNVS